MSALCNHIAHVFLVSSKEQMSRVYARRIVAAVQNVFAFRDWSVVKFPGYATRLPTFGSKFELSVPIFKLPSSPRPTGICATDRNEREESFGNRDSRTHHLGAPFRAADDDPMSRREMSLAGGTRLDMLSDSHDDSFQSLRSGSRFGARTPPRSEVITGRVGTRAA